LRGARYFATIDLLSGYRPLGTTDRAVQRSVFSHYIPKDPSRTQLVREQSITHPPWDIISLKSDLIVEIQDPTSRKKQTVHVDRLLPCQQPASETQSPAVRPTRLRSPPRRRSTVEPDPATMEHQSVSSQPSLSLRRSSRLRLAPPYIHSYV